MSLLPGSSRFTCFSILPTELRLKIVDFALQTASNPRILFIRDIKLLPTPADVSTIDGEQRKTIFTLSFTPQPPPPAILFVNRELRNVAQQQYHLVTLRVRTQDPEGHSNRGLCSPPQEWDPEYPYIPTTYFNPSTDTLFLAPKTFVLVPSRPTVLSSIELQLPVGRGIESLALPCPTRALLRCFLQLTGDWRGEDYLREIFLREPALTEGIPDAERYRINGALGRTLGYQNDVFRQFQMYAREEFGEIIAVKMLLARTKGPIDEQEMRASIERARESFAGPMEELIEAPWRDFRDRLPTFLASHMGDIGAS